MAGFYRALEVLVQRHETGDPAAEWELLARPQAGGAPLAVAIGDALAERLVELGAECGHTDSSPWAQARAAGYPLSYAQVAAEVDAWARKAGAGPEAVEIEAGPDKEDLYRLVDVDAAPRGYAPWPESRMFWRRLSEAEARAAWEAVAPAVGDGSGYTTHGGTSGPGGGPQGGGSRGVTPPAAPTHTLTGSAPGGSPGALPDQAAVKSREPGPEAGCATANGGERQGGGPEGEGVAAPASTPPVVQPRFMVRCRRGCNYTTTDPERNLACRTHDVRTKVWPAAESEPPWPDDPDALAEATEAAKRTLEAARETLAAESDQPTSKLGTETVFERCPGCGETAESGKSKKKGGVNLIACEGGMQAWHMPCYLERQRRTVATHTGSCDLCGEKAIRGLVRCASCAYEHGEADGTELTEQRRLRAIDRAGKCKPYKARKRKSGTDPECQLCPKPVKQGERARRCSATSSRCMHEDCYQEALKALEAK